MRDAYPLQGDELESAVLDASGHGDNENRAELLHEIALGRESARTEPLLDNDTVFAMARQRAMRP
jgi:hypothetical protein